MTRNVLQENSIGVNLNGTMSRVDFNCIRENNAGGSASGTGIYSDQGLKSAKINSNVFVNNTAAAITLLDAAGAGQPRRRARTEQHVDERRRPDQHRRLDELADPAELRYGRRRRRQSSWSRASMPTRPSEISNNKLNNGDDSGINIAPDAMHDSTIKSNTAKGNFYLGIVVQTGAQRRQRDHEQRLPGQREQRRQGGLCGPDQRRRHGRHGQHLEERQGQDVVPDWHRKKNQGRRAANSTSPRTP